MDRELTFSFEELQFLRLFLGFFGIFKELANGIIVSRKIFSQITLAFVLPLSFIYLVQTKLSSSPKGGMVYFIIYGLTSEFGLIKFVHWYDLASMIGFFTLSVLCHIFFLVLSLLSTSAVVYTIACAYTKKKITFSKVASVVPTVWKRLLITFLWTFLIMFLYNLFSLLIVFLITFTLKPAEGFDSIGTWIMIGIIDIIIYAIGFIYISVIWHLASVVSVMEESYGYKAILKSKALIKGKIWISLVIFITLQISFMIAVAAFDSLVVHGRIGLMGKVSLGIFFLLLLSILIHFGLVVQTVLYFVCKSYHHDNIDKSFLAKHLEAYNGDYVPLIKCYKDIREPSKVCLTIRLMVYPISFLLKRHH
ncbi:hypothetical protein MKX03_036714 [Papaver bracteatum]|nr:hypothetical protein MKX03_036714 [Papaver bracteatum]